MDSFTKDKWAKDGEATIRYHYWENPLTKTIEPTAYEWIGPLNAPISLHPNEVLVLPWKLIKLREQWPLSLEDLYVREDASWGRLYTQLENRWMIHCRAFNRFEARIILTLSIWGIGYVDPREFPTWKCLTKRSPWK